MILQSLIFSASIFTLIEEFLYFIVQNNLSRVFILLFAVYTLAGPKLFQIKIKNDFIQA